MTMAIARTKLSDQLVLHVAREIVRGDLLPGEHLASEHELAAAFGISKPVVRESIRALASIGLVHAQQGKRTTVLESSEWNVLDETLHEALQIEGRGSELAGQFYELRVLLETSSAAQAAERATPEQVAELRRLVERLREISRTTQDLDEFLVADRAFHDLVAKASGNVVLRQVIRDVHGFLAIAWARTSISEEELDLLADFHADIASAIADGDAERARSAMAGHLERAAAKERAKLVAEVV